MPPRLPRGAGLPRGPSRGGSAGWRWQPPSRPDGWGWPSAAVVYVGGLLVQGVSLAITLVPRAIVWLALAAQDGADWWSIAGRAGGAVATMFASSQVIWWLIGLELLGVAALVGLQKMLRDETRGRDVEEEKQ